MAIVWDFREAMAKKFFIPEIERKKTGGKSKLLHNACRVQLLGRTFLIPDTKIYVN